MSSTHAYFYDNQMRRYLQQFIRLFSGFSVEMGTGPDGQSLYQTVPVRYGDMTRMASHILRDNSENMLNTVPFISCYVTELNIAPEKRTHAQYTDKVQIFEKEYNDETGEYENEVGNTYQVTRYQPVPYDLTMQVDIWTSNTNQKLQLLEQILVLYNPSINIHTNDNYVDWTSLSYVELTGVTWSTRSVPAGVDEQIEVATLTFEMPIYISPPAKLQKQTLIHTIINNIYTMGNDELINFENGEVFTPDFTGYGIVTLENYKLRYEDGSAIILNRDGGDTDSEGNTLDWTEILKAYGELREGVSQLRLRRLDDPSDNSQDIIGTLSYDVADNQKLTFTVDTDTLPADTQGTVDAIINPQGAYPGDGTLPAAAVGQKYLVLDEVPSGGSWGTITANKYDIITYNGSSWIVSFDSSSSSGSEYTTNSATSKQYEWTGSVWQDSSEGTYSAGYWRLYL